jgi:hypothetical protein
MLRDVPKCCKDSVLGFIREQQNHKVKNMQATISNKLKRALTKKAHQGPKVSAIWPIKMAFLMLMVATSHMLSAYEVSNVTKTLRFEQSTITGSFTFNPITSPLTAYGNKHSGLLLSFDYYSNGSICDSAHDIARFELPDSYYSPYDYERTQRLSLHFSPIKGLSLTISGFPKSPSGVRHLGRLDYNFQSLDPLPTSPAWTCNASIPKIYNIAIYMDMNNLFVQISLPGLPLADVYTAPFNVGPGYEFMRRLNEAPEGTLGWNITTYFESSGTLFGTSTVKLYGLDFQQVKNDIQVEFGGRHFPFAYPFLFKGKNATATFMVIN